MPASLRGWLLYLHTFIWRDKEIGLCFSTCCHHYRNAGNLMVHHNPWKQQDQTLVDLEGCLLFLKPSITLFFFHYRRLRILFRNTSPWVSRIKDSRWEFCGFKRSWNRCPFTYFVFKMEQVIPFPLNMNKNFYHYQLQGRSVSLLSEEDLRWCAGVNCLNLN